MTGLDFLLQEQSNAVRCNLLASKLIQEDEGARLTHAHLHRDHARYINAQAVHPPATAIREQSVVRVGIFGQTSMIVQSQISSPSVPHPVRTQ